MLVLSYSTFSSYVPLPPTFSTRTLYPTLLSSYTFLSYLTLLSYTISSDPALASPSDSSLILYFPVLYSSTLLLSYSYSTLSSPSYPALSSHSPVPHPTLILHSSYSPVPTLISPTLILHSSPSYPALSSHSLPLLSSYTPLLTLSPVLYTPILLSCPHSTLILHSSCPSYRSLILHSSLSCPYSPFYPTLILLPPDLFSSSHPTLSSPHPTLNLYFHPTLLSLLSSFYTLLSYSVHTLSSLTLILHSSYFPVLHSPLSCNIILLFCPTLSSYILLPPILHSPLLHSLVPHPTLLSLNHHH